MDIFVRPHKCEDLFHFELRTSYATSCLKKTDDGRLVIRSNINQTVIEVEASVPPFYSQIPKYLVLNKFEAVDRSTVVKDVKAY